MSIGTKNLGLIKAIHVGVNPPLNTKILWYYDGLLPYTTGPAKVHYYYDVISSQWLPLSAGLVVNGIYTYLAYATTCSGTGFALEFDPDVHCFWAAVTSGVPIDNVDLVPALFEKRWTRFCKCDAGSGGGNFTYVGYADDCEGTNFGTTLEYPVECDDCEFADTFSYASGNSSFIPTNTGDGVEIVLNDVYPGQQLVLDVRRLGVILLDNLASYCVQISTLPNYEGEMEISLGSDTILLDGPTSLIKQTIVNQGSQLIINVPSNGQPPINSTIVIKVGSVECCAEEEDGECFNCRKYFAIITSPTPIADVDLTADLFENQWISICCDEGGGCDCEAEFELLEQQLENLNQIVNEQMVSMGKQFSQVNGGMSEIQSQITQMSSENDTKFNEMQEVITTMQSNLEVALQGIGEAIQSLNSRVTAVENKIVPKVYYETIKGEVANTANEEIKKFKDGDFAANNVAIQSYTDGKVEENKAYLDAQVTSINGVTSNHETRITALEDSETP